MTFNNLWGYTLFNEEIIAFIEEKKAKSPESHNLRVLNKRA